MSWFKPLAASVLAQVVILLTITLFERLWPAGAKGPAGAQQPDGADRATDSRRPAGPQPPAGPRHPAGRRRNLGIGAIGLATLSLAGAWLAPLSTWAVNAAGGGIFVLPSSGWGLAAGIAIYVCAMDLGEYLFHRAQHALPWMWAMHSLHHSDPHFNSTTTVRHFWLDSWMKGATIWLAVGVLFKASSVVLGAYGVLSYYNFLAHADVRLSFKGASWMLNSPAYHRLHHSAAPEHANANYAALLPIFDLLSGAYRRPRPGEYPATGLMSGESPESLLGSLIWPWRKRPKSLAARAAAVD